MLGDRREGDARRMLFVHRLRVCGAGRHRGHCTMIGLLPHDLLHFIAGSV
jgi:hypothetical protein